MVCAISLHLCGLLHLVSCLGGSMAIFLMSDTYFTLCLCLRHFASVLFVSSLIASYPPIWSHIGISSLSFWDGRSVCSLTLYSFPARIMFVRSLGSLVLEFGF